MPARSALPPAQNTPGRPPRRDRVGSFLRLEAVGGVFLLVATAAALVAANSPLAQPYARVRDTTLGPASLHLDLTVGQWAADGLLAVFFFVVGVELKREFVAGDLHSPRTAAVPVAAAVGGVVTPVLVFLAVDAATDAGAAGGWAVPTATDIAFAVAVLAVVGRHLPTSLRTFLLTLAVVDDLIAVSIIAFVFSDGVSLVWLGLALIPLAGFALLVQRERTIWWLLLPLAVVTWALVHASGVHATVAGVLLGFTVPVLARSGTGDRVQRALDGMTTQLEHAVRPFSTAVAVPVFAFFAAGVTVGGLAGLREAVSEPLALAIIAGLVVGKTVGITAATWLITRLPRFTLPARAGWADVAGVALLAGIGFTVALLVGELAFGPGSPADDTVKVGILVGSLIAAVLAALVLLQRGRHHQRASIEGADH